MVTLETIVVKGSLTIPHYCTDTPWNRNRHRSPRSHYGRSGYIIEVDSCRILDFLDHFNYILQFLCIVKSTAMCYILKTGYSMVY